MRRIVLLLITLLFVSALSAPTALAASPHFKKNGEPACTISGTAATQTVTCNATLAGLGVALTLPGIARAQAPSAAEATSWLAVLAAGA